VKTVLKKIRIQIRRHVLLVTKKLNDASSKEFQGFLVVDFSARTKPKAVKQKEASWTSSSTSRDVS